MNKMEAIIAMMKGEKVFHKATSYVYFYDKKLDFRQQYLSKSDNQFGLIEKAYTCDMHEDGYEILKMTFSQLKVGDKFKFYEDSILYTMVKVSDVLINTENYRFNAVYESAKCLIPLFIGENEYIKKVG